MIPDDNLLKFSYKTPFDADKVIKTAISWVMTQMFWAIEQKREDLAHIKAGAINPFEPKTIWVAMISKPNNTSSLEEKYNQILKDELVHRERHYYLDVNAALSEST